ncbi:MAG: hypothetical protein WBV61_12785 [Rhodanobacteraceae bacterium]
MRRIAVLPLSIVALLACALAACSPSTPNSPSASPSKPVAKPTEPAKAAAPAVKPVAEVPEGQCGDQSGIPADQRIANTAHWTTASEQDNFGYDVYRGDSEKGPFKKLTAKPVLGAGTSDETHKYEYRDDTIDPCKTYWYYVEGISTSGQHEKFTPTFKAPAKRRAQGSAPANAPAKPPAPASDLNASS